MNNRAPVSKQALIATAAAFALVFGVVWFASSLGGGVRGEADVDKPALPDRVGRDTYGSAPPGEPKVAVVKATSSDTAITAPPRVAGKPRPVTPRDMFPVGNVVRDMPEFAHPYRQIAELFPSFEYENRLWMATGRFVNVTQADLTPTGYQFTDGRQLYALANTSAPDSVLFVQSANDPYKFAVYRRA